MQSTTADTMMGRHERFGVLTALRRHRFGLLLGALMMLLGLLPVLDGGEAGGFSLTALFTMVLVAAVLAASARRATAIAALALAAPWLYLSWLHPLWQADDTGLLPNLLLIALCGLVLALVLAEVIRAGRVGVDTLCGAIAVYLLLAVIWAVGYGVIETLQPGAFGLKDSALTTTWTQLLYFSLVTLTTLGYGDITPVSAVAQIWSALEAMTGTLYLAVLIARLVSLYRQDEA